ncbi:MAG: death-on-curing protein [Tannerella sp.]|jgi:hypothetical protein|nr:death-on-curing protein [Tannerella sp.]
MDNRSEIIIYQTENGLTKTEVRRENETVCLPLDRRAAFFRRDQSTVSRYTRPVFEESECDARSTVANLATVQTE